MRKKIIFYGFLLILVSSISIQLNAQNTSTDTLSNRIANYDINLTLDVVAKTIDAKMKLNWKNTSNDTISELHFHMYMNAFKNSASTFMKESGGQHRGQSLDGNNKIAWGSIDIKNIETESGDNLTDSCSYIQPDDSNKNDQTVMKVKLSKPIFPGKDINLNILFKTKLPKVFARTGYSNDYFLVGQWFPKIGVYEPEGMRYAKTGQWNCHQFHANSEFYADFGVYNVSITLPKKYIVGATGKQQSIKNINDSLKTATYLAKDVIDFAWTASPKFQTVESKWNHNNKEVDIKLLIQPEHIKLSNRHIQAVKAALKYFTEHLGEYPYDNITIVDPPIAGGSSGGMEYPMFITAGSVAKMPAGIKLTEMVVIHEFGHQYFMGIFATNEFEEAWMDEGMNTYFETRIMDETYGKYNSIIDFFGYSSGDKEMQRIGYVHSKIRNSAPSFNYSWEYPNGAYSVMTYNKPATFLNTLENIIGTSTIDEIFKTYYKEYKFKHPDSRDFIDIVNKVVKQNHGSKFGEDMNWFFDQVLYGTSTCDYELIKISNKKIKNNIGLFDTDSGRTLKKYDKTSQNYRSEISIRRNGEMYMPLEVLITFENGEQITKYKDGKLRNYLIVLETDKKVVSAQIDPEYKILLDTNFVNNSKTAKEETSGIWKLVLKILFWLQNAMQSVAFFA